MMAPETVMVAVIGGRSQIIVIAPRPRSFVDGLMGIGAARGNEIAWGSVAISIELCVAMPDLLRDAHVCVAFPRLGIKSRIALVPPIITGPPSPPPAGVGRMFADQRRIRY